MLSKSFSAIKARRIERNGGLEETVVRLVRDQLEVLKKVKEEASTCVSNNNDSDEAQPLKPNYMIACMMMGEEPKKQRTYRYLVIEEVEKHLTMKFEEDMVLWLCGATTVRRVI